MPDLTWYKGNIHTHTNESDGDAPPETVVRWYRDHGYDFLVLTDHNKLTLLEQDDGGRGFNKLLLIPGEEVGVNIHEGQKSVHLNAIGISRLVEPVDAKEVVPTLQANIDAIVDAGGIACINHPNYTWAFDHEAISRTTGASLLEVFSGPRLANVEGAPGRRGNEGIWDGVLSAGKLIFGIATDDAHHFNDIGGAEIGPGVGWVMVRAAALTPEAIVIALGTGDFYASTGVALQKVDLAHETIALGVEQEANSTYATTFIGRDGTTLAQAVGTEAVYQIRGGEGYVRAVVMSSSGGKAWTQPVLLR